MARILALIKLPVFLLVNLTIVIPFVILFNMKTAISINKDIFNEAEQTAQQLGLTRSKLYSLAILEYVKTHKPEAITAALNEVYSDNSSLLDSDIHQLNFDLLAQDEW